MQRGLWAAVLLCIVAWLTVIVIRRRGSFRTPVRLAVLSAVIISVWMLLYAVFAPPIMGRGEKRRPIGVLVNSHVPKGEPLYVYRPDYQDFLFYVRPPLEYLVEPAQIDARVRFLLLRDSVYQQFQHDPAIAGRLGATLCTFPYGSSGGFRLVELQKAGGERR